MLYHSLYLVSQFSKHDGEKSSAGASNVEALQNRMTDYIVAWPDSIYDSTKAKESRLSLLIMEIACSTFGGWHEGHDTLPEFIHFTNLFYENEIFRCVVEHGRVQNSFTLNANETAMT